MFHDRIFMQTSNEILIVVITGSFIVLVMAIFIVISLFLYQQRHYRHVKEKEQLSAEFAQTLLQSQIEIQEQTLSYVGKELHDNLGHTASLIKINLNTIGDLHERHIIQKIENAIELTRQLITDIKVLSMNLSGDRVNEKGFIAAVKNDIKRIGDAGIFDILLEIDDNFPAIAPDKAVILYRMVQEILNNIIKHSAAKKIHITFYHGEKNAILELRDDGIGFDNELLVNGKGAGLLNLQSRARLINAIVDIQTKKGEGTVVTIELQ